MKGLFPVLGGVLLVSALTLGFLFRGPLGYFLGFRECCSQRAANERFAASTLKSIVAAQFDYGYFDRDGNGVKDYWRKDITGLYTLPLASDPERPPMRLIEISVAAADDRPVSDLSPYAVRSPRSGYWYRAILHEGERAPSPDRFAACAIPDSRDAGRWTYIVSEENLIYRKDLGGKRGVDRYPRDPVKDGWQEMY